MAGEAIRTEPGFFAPLENDTKKARQKKDNAKRAVNSALTTSNRDEVPHLFLIPGAGVTPARGRCAPPRGSRIQLTPCLFDPRAAPPARIISTTAPAIIAAPANL